jgi:hypothetical protein
MEDATESLFLSYIKVFYNTSLAISINCGFSNDALFSSAIIIKKSPAYIFISPLGIISFSPLLTPTIKHPLGHVISLIFLCSISAPSTTDISKTTLFLSASFNQLLFLLARLFSNNVS